MAAKTEGGRERGRERERESLRESLGSISKVKDINKLEMVQCRA